MFKAVMVLRRKQGMSPEEFREHYETVHAPLTLECLPGIVEYRRLYVNHGTSPFGHPDAELDFDVITEVTFASREAYDEAMLAMRDERLAGLLRDDQALLFDAEAPNRRFFATECVSKIA
jgi:uncharacterized protein (TIGR02118 family)